MARKPLSAVDAAWLRMEDPTNLMMITGVMIFGAPVEYERLKARLEKQLLCFDRFRKRVVQPLVGTAYWQDDPDFDIRYHLQQTVLPPPGDQAALQDVASLLASTQLDPARPLWQFHLVKEYGEGSALICRLHHCIGDGLALVHVLLSMSEAGPDAPWPVIEPEIRQRRRHRPASKLVRPLRQAFQTKRRVGKALVRQCRQVRADRSHLADLARVPVRGTTSLARLLLLWPDPKTPYKGDLGVPKRAAWSAAIPLQDVKITGKGLGGTVNDVLLTAMSGALRRYLLDRGEEVEGLNFRAVIPVNLRRPGTEEELGNKFGLVFLPLPIGLADPNERMDELKKRMDALKDSLEAPVAFGILTAIGMAPEPIQDVVVNIFGMKGTAVMTNVMGPQQTVYLAGAPLESLMFWVPQSGHLGLGVSILSYTGKVWMGVITDEGLVPDPDAIIDAFHSEFDELLALARQAKDATGPEEKPGKPEVPDTPPEAEAEDSLEESTSEPEEDPEVPSVPEVPETPVTPPEATSGGPERCQALTKAGAPCKNLPLAGSEFCRVHQGQAAGSPNT